MIFPIMFIILDLGQLRFYFTHRWVTIGSLGMSTSHTPTTGDSLAIFCLKLKHMQHTVKSCSTQIININNKDHYLTGSTLSTSTILPCPCNTSSVKSDICMWMLFVCYSHQYSTTNSFIPILISLTSLNIKSATHITRQTYVHVYVYVGLSSNNLSM